MTGCLFPGPKLFVIKTGSLISGMTPQSGKKREEILQLLRSTAQGFGEGMRAMRLGSLAGRPAII
jgi:hypothetical protein